MSGVRPMENEIKGSTRRDGPEDHQLDKQSHVVFGSCIRANFRVSTEVCERTKLEGKWFGHRKETKY